MNHKQNKVSKWRQKSIGSTFWIFHVNKAWKKQKCYKQKTNSWVNYLGKEVVAYYLSFNMFKYMARIIYYTDSDKMEGPNVKKIYNFLLF